MRIILLTESRRARCFPRTYRSHRAWVLWFSNAHNPAFTVRCSDTECSVSKLLDQLCTIRAYFWSFHHIHISSDVLCCATEHKPNTLTKNGIALSSEYVCAFFLIFFLTFLWRQAHLRASRKRVIFATQDTRHEIYRPNLAGVARERSPEQKWKFPRPGPLVCWVDHRKTMSVSRQPLHGAWSHRHTGESFSHGKNSLNIHEQSKRWQTNSICVWSFGNTQSEREREQERRVVNESETRPYSCLTHRLTK